MTLTMMITFMTRMLMPGMILARMHWRITTIIHIGFSQMLLF